MLRQLRPFSQIQKKRPQRGAGGIRLGPFLEWARNRAPVGHYLK